MDGLLHHGIGLQRRLSQVLRHKAATVGLDGMSFLQHTQIFVDTADDTGHSGLTGTRGTVEHQVVGHLRRFQSLGLALLLELHEVGQ